MFNAMIGKSIEEIATPAALVDLDILDANLRRMGEIAAAGNMSYRPHTKSHKQPLIAHRQMAAGAVGICCAKLSEAEVMVAGGLPDILITSPVVTPQKIRHLAALGRQARMAVVADSEPNIQALAAAAREAGSELGVFVEVDVGQGRCGVTDSAKAAELALAIERAPGLRFRGLQGYQGSIQLERSAEKRREGAQRALDLLLDAADVVRRAGATVTTLTGGGTGTIPIDIALGGLTELQPGSYLFMDSRYVGIEWDGVDTSPPFRSSLTVLAGIISRPTLTRAVLDSGWKAISMDGGDPVPTAGGRARFRFAGDEHAVLEQEEELSLKVGDPIRLTPSHCDTTIGLYDHCYAIRAGVVEAVWPIPGRGKVW